MFDRSAPGVLSTLLGLLVGLLLLTLAACGGGGSGGGDPGGGGGGGASPQLRQILGAYRTIPGAGFAFLSGTDLNAGGRLLVPAGSDALSRYELDVPVVGATEPWYLLRRDASSPVWGYRQIPLGAGGFLAPSDVAIFRGSLREGDVTAHRLSLPGGLFDRGSIGFQLDADGDRILVSGEGRVVLVGAEAASPRVFGLPGAAWVSARFVERADAIVVAGGLLDGRLLHAVLDLDGNVSSQEALDSGAGAASIFGFVEEFEQGYVLRSLGAGASGVAMAFSNTHQLLAAVEANSVGVTFTPTGRPGVVRSEPIFEDEFGLDPYIVEVTGMGGAVSHARDDGGRVLTATAGGVTSIASFSLSWSFGWGTVLPEAATQYGMSAERVLHGTQSGTLHELERRTGASVGSESILAAPPNTLSFGSAAFFPDGSNYLLAVTAEDDVALYTRQAGSGALEGRMFERSGLTVGFVTTVGDLSVVNGMATGPLFVAQESLPDFSFALSCRPAAPAGGRSFDDFFTASAVRTPAPRISVSRRSVSELFEYAASAQPLQGRMLRDEVTPVRVCGG